MKILWLCSWYPHTGDAFDGDFIQRQAKAVSRHQPIELIHVVQNIDLLTKETYRTEESITDNLKQTIVYIPFLKTPFEKLSKIIFNRRYYKSLKKELNSYIEKNGKPDIVHVHVPVKAGVGALWLKRKWNIPFILTEHSNSYNKTGNENYFSNSLYFRIITNRTIREASRLITVSKFLGDSINESVCKKKYSVIPNVVDTSVFYYVAKKTTNEPFRFLHVSNLYPLKNPLKMLDAIALYLKNGSNAEFVFIGNKDDRLQKKAEQLNLSRDNIKFLGEMPYEKVAEEMKQSDALFLFSKSETFSCVTAEALCCGLPVIASHVGALPELITTENGILIEPDNIEALADAFRKITENHQNYNRKKNAEAATVKYNYDVVAKQILAVYRSLLNIF